MTDSDAIGLSERLRDMRIDGAWYLRLEAATALDALQARVKELEAADRYANLISIIADIREKSGLGGYPMLSELADAIGSKLADAESRATSAEQERYTLEAQLPDGMKHCTITFHECEKGHGRLSATNWIDSGCLCCQRDEAYERAAKIAKDRAGKLRAKAKRLKQPHSQHYFAQAIEASVIETAIRRLAGPEKIAAASEGEERK